MHHGLLHAVLARIADKTIGLEEDADFVRIASETLRALGVTARPLYRIVGGRMSVGAPMMS